ncbi:hypothetical protein Efla_000977 [Eimeria flavescens]
MAVASQAEEAPRALLHEQRAAALSSSSGSTPVTAAAAAAAGGSHKEGCCQTQAARHCLEVCQRRWPICEPQAMASQLAKVSACKYGCFFDVGIRPQDCGLSCERLVNFSQVQARPPCCFCAGVYGRKTRGLTSPRATCALAAAAATAAADEWLMRELLLRTHRLQSLLVLHFLLLQLLLLLQRRLRPKLLTRLGYWALRRDERVHLTHVHYNPTACTQQHKGSNAATQQQHQQQQQQQQQEQKQQQQQKRQQQQKQQQQQMEGRGNSQEPETEDCGGDEGEDESAADTQKKEEGK